MIDRMKVMNDVAVRESFRLYSILTNCYSEYTTAFCRNPDMSWARPRMRDTFVRKAAEFLDYHVPGWSSACEVPFKLRAMVDARYGRRVA